MNTAYAYEVVEDIRKYCVLPNVVILFSVDMFQLEQTVEQYFVKSFDSIIRGAVEENHPSKFTAKFSREQCHKTAVSYLNKLIPGLHRINLPDIDAELRNSAKEIELMTPLSSVGNGEPMAYQAAIKEMLRKKCQVELNDDGFGVHPFVPSRMRELNHFVNRMCSMGDDILFTRQELIKWGAGIDVANVNMEKAQALVSHLEVLLDYFLYVWCELRLDHRERMVIIDIHNAETEDKVYAALESLRRKYSDERELADLEPEDGWSELMKGTQYLRENRRRKFACAIELYFQLFRNFLLVNDCVRRRENDGHQT